MYVVIPDEIENHILSYTGIIKERNGKYMSQIDNKDRRYTLLRTISRNVVNISTHWMFLQVNKYYTILIHQDNEDGIKYCYTFVARCCGETNCDWSNVCRCEQNVHDYGYSNRRYDYTCI